MSNVKAKPLTIAAIERLGVGEKTPSDANAPGLYVMRNRDGSRSWRWRRVVKGKPIQRVYGTTREINLPDARAWALNLNRQIAEGIDLDAVRREEEGAIEAERETVAAQAVADQVEADRLAMTVRVAFDRYMAAIRSENAHAAKTLAMKESRFNTDVLPRVGDMPLSDVTHDDLWAIIEAKKAAGLPSAANHLVPDIKVFFRWCMIEGKTVTKLRSNPSSDLRKLCKETPREREFSPLELRLFIKALGTSPDDFTRRFFTLLLLSGQRLTNVLEATPAQWCDEVGAWEIPVTKNGDANVVPLSTWGRSLFQRKEVWLFASSRTKGPRAGGIPKLCVKLNDAMLKAAPEGTVIEHWQRHDFRRTVASGLARLKVGEDLIERILAHRIATIKRTYNRYQYLDEKRDALALWEAHVIKIAREEGVADALGIPPEPTKLALVA